jgi:ParB-like chromosome segregation protein Spo0J
MDERTLEAERQSIKTYGFIDPITVRPHPEVEGGFQIIDGEHRWRVAQEQEIESVPLIVLDLGDTAARKLTIILNETRGKPDDVLLGTLLAEIAAEDDDLANGLRYDETELAHLLSLADADWSRFDADPDANISPDDDDPDDQWRTISARVPIDFMETWESAVERVKAEREGLHSDEKVAAGQVIEMLVASYLAGAPA